MKQNMMAITAGITMITGPSILKPPGASNEQGLNNAFIIFMIIFYAQ
jgi:hypothetical protein